MKIIGIMAATPEGIIGKEHALPWYYPEELDYFRHLTQGSLMVMGRKTFEATPPDLFKDHPPLVFSRNHPLKRLPNHLAFSSLEDFLSWCPSSPHKEMFMIGGAEIAHLFLRENVISEFLLTKIHKSYSGDTTLDLTFFETWEKKILTSNLTYTTLKLQNPKETLI
ncbi:MAG: hypothetical protein B7Y25_01565 [Alphaproteobacteria bacterium 16-39-46]|nr:MAG: hypothetical protein B7Y25_01565 [Alphaproteobacteria bacterium 16-39-46]OZA44033.1 MAG: hypothetical protein B7X84_01550 [Alphaproteobacteria bacterium 17-39-52]